MAVAYQSVATAQGSATCNKPSGVANGDLMIAHVAVYDNTGVTVSPPSGWTLLRGPTRNNGFFNMTAYTFYKVAGGSEPSSYLARPRRRRPDRCRPHRRHRQQHHAHRHRL